MARYAIPMDLYIEASQVFHWATKRHFQLWFTGQESTRHRRTEIVLKRLSKRGKLRSILYGKKLIYVAPKNVKGKTCFLQVKKCPIYYRKSAHFEKRKIKIII